MKSSFVSILVIIFLFLGIANKSKSMLLDEASSFLDTPDALAVSDTGCAGSADPGSGGCGSGGSGGSGW